MSHLRLEVSVLAAVVLIALTSFGLPTAMGAATEPITLDVWPGQAPGEKGDIAEEKLMPPQGEKPVQRLTNVTKPTITVYKPEPAKDTGAAVLVCPGGGYSILAIDLEGKEVADWLNSIGVTGIVLKYRVPKRKDLPKHLPMLQDAQRALSLVRSHANDWNIDPGRLGILGFSAGGHLSAATATNFDQRQYEPLDEVDKIDCRPDFAVLIYPAYLRLGDANPRNPTPDDHLAPEIRVSSQTPPTFIALAADDRISAEGGPVMYLALKRAGVSAELHVYAKGGHGFGLRPSDNPCSTWPARCAEWMKSRGLLAKQP
jgi:acetyl esterase/lipase